MTDGLARAWRAGFPCAVAGLFRIAAVAAFLHAGPVRSQPVDWLDLRSVPPQAPGASFGGAWKIHAVGGIDSDAGRRLTALVTEHRIPPKSYIYLNSPTTGSIEGGVGLGRAIRAAGLIANVNDAKRRAGQLMPGRCVGACALAYLGSEYRFFDKKSTYGIDRLHFSSISAGVSGKGPVLSTMIDRYIRDMGVDSKIFRDAVANGKDRYAVFDAETLRRTKIVNDGVKHMRWSIEHVAGGIYLKGDRENVRGVNKMRFVCTPHKELFLYALFDPVGGYEEVLEMRVGSLSIDGDSVRLAGDLRSDAPRYHEGLINIAYHLDDDLVARLKKAKSVGLSLQHTEQSGLFLGIDEMPFAEGRPMLPQVLERCGRN